MWGVGIQKNPINEKIDIKSYKTGYEFLKAFLREI